MSERKTGAPPNPARAAREKRLAEALRANLRRRKQAARAGASGGEADTAGPTAEPPTDAGSRDKGG